jgi:zinc D-Ala-D-Ala carboxypeptidase
MTRLSPNFTRAELVCPCCGQLATEAGVISAARFRQLIDGLEALRAAAGHALPVTSGYRCQRHNAAVGGAAQSRHMSGDAVDISLPPAGVLRLAAIALDMPVWGGIGVRLHRSPILHLDMRQGRVVFGYGQ